MSSDNEDDLMELEDERSLDIEEAVAPLPAVLPTERLRLLELEPEEDDGQPFDLKTTSGPALCDYIARLKSSLLNLDGGQSYVFGSALAVFGIAGPDQLLHSNIEDIYMDLAEE